MRAQVTLFLGIFSIMALSNAIVPVLPAFAAESTWTGVIYSAYFLGAFISTVPAGILADRYGRITLMRAGLCVTVASGLVLIAVTNPLFAAGARFAEGIGAGLFVVPALAAVNRETEHEKMGGYFMALMNAGLVLGLIAAGFLDPVLGKPAAGIGLFTALCSIPAIASLIARESGSPAAGHDIDAFTSLGREYRGIWISSMILIGITGVATSLYPKFSGLDSDLVSIWIAGMSIATIVSVLVVSRIPLEDIRTIRISALLMAAGIVATYYTPAGILLVGAVAGMVMIAQMEFLSRASDHQGIAMGLFSMTSYLGMAALPFLAGLVADISGFFFAFLAAAVLALAVAGMLGRD